MPVTKTLQEESINCILMSRGRVIHLMVTLYDIIFVKSRIHEIRAHLSEDFHQQTKIHFPFDYESECTQGSLSRGVLLNSKNNSTATQTIYSDVLSVKEKMLRVVM